MKNSWSIPVIILVVLLLCVVCLCFVAGGAALWIFNSQVPANQINQPIGMEAATSTPVVIRPTVTTPSEPSINPSEPGATPAEPAPSPAPPVSQSGVVLDPAETLRLLKDTIVPINDIPDLARRLEGKQDIPPTLPAPSPPPQIGDQQSFWALDTDTDENFSVDATLRFITDHTYFWIGNDVTYRERDLAALAETFEEQIYPTNREFFGSEWTPGVDSDPHLYILYVRGIGSGIAGYFSSQDSYNPLIQEYSNGHEMFVFNADKVDFDENFTYGVLAHEFQHMIHWYRDPNEDTWMNEGFSDLAMLLNGYDIGGHDYLYVDEPDLQLNDWPNDPNLTPPHYGASFLFTTYFLDRFGEEATKALVAEVENGMESIDIVLNQLGITDPQTRATIQADDVFQDWTIATYLQDEDVGDGRFTYHNYPTAPQPVETETITNCGSRPFTRSVHQYGVDYIRLDCRGATNLVFEGSTIVTVIPEDPYSGTYAFWSNKGDESDMTLTQEFDFTKHQGPLTLSYWTWYDIEEDYDYLYLVASQDGESWEMVTTPSGTDKDPVGANYGWGYTGLSGGGDQAQWIREEIDISQFAGEKVQLRFEYITDAAVNGEGLLLDDIAIPEIGYASDFEQDEGGWSAAGFVRLQNALPQDFRLALITYGRDTRVNYIPVTADNSAQVSIDFGGDVDEAILVVSGTTRYTRQTAGYRFFFQP